MAAGICCAPSVPSATHSTARLDQSAWGLGAGNGRTGRGWGNVALPGFRVVICACLGALSLAACSSSPLGRDVAGQRLGPLLADPGGLPGGTVGQVAAGGLGQALAGAADVAGPRVAGGALAQGLAGLAPQQSLAAGPLSAGIGTPNGAA